MVLSDVKVLDRRAKVAELIDSNSKSWKRELVNQIFDDAEAEAIFRILISSLNSKDKLIWKGTHTGCFSVRSAYHMMKERDFANQGSPSSEVWNPPPFNWYKINWDGAIDKFKGLIGIGICVRDCEGHVVATLRHNKHMYPDPLLVESYGALQAIKFGIELGLGQVIFEGDSLQVINNLKATVEVWSSASMFVSEAKELSSCFAKCDFSHVRRNGNNIAHLLAKNTLTISDFIVTIEEVPPCISSLL
ncbi:hypothetical protein F2P56_011245 [Juglans regia]|uniref:RNase H type-1 domain-containing protein n=1 Tax=Juglans regia TaxID=51240 RepID=A0A834CTY0_JUGRE|nr:hypothetical protein F2P56_011245 [Juglans regia]